MNPIDEYLEEVHKSLATLMEGAARMQNKVKEARGAWPSHQIREGVDWRPRTETSPDEMIWASDGIGVWLIHGRGEPISKGATRVKWWTTACIPAPPKEREEKLASSRQ